MPAARAAAMMLRILLDLAVMVLLFAVSVSRLMDGSILGIMQGLAVLLGAVYAGLQAWENLQRR
jgi:hypothetical protein